MNEIKNPPGACCPDLPELRRLTYFYGQLLQAQDLRDEQSYFRDKIRLLTRCLHGHGVVCGLGVSAVPAEEPCEDDGVAEIDQLRARIAQLEEHIDAAKEELEAAQSEQRAAAIQERLEKLAAERERLTRELEELCPPADETPKPAMVRIDCGVAIDCQGEVIVLRRPVELDLWRLLSHEDRRRLKKKSGRSLWLSVCFCELPVEPVRPVTSEACPPTSGCRHAKIQDSYRFELSLEPPAPDERCEPCCCDECCCVLLARIDGLELGRPLAPDEVHGEVRRPLATYELATIAGQTWVHGGSYTDEEAGALLGRDGGGALELHFSRPVLTSTLREGAFKIYLEEGSGSRKGSSGGVFHIEGEIVDLPAAETTQVLRYRQITDDKFNTGDRIVFELYGDVILDPCCRALDANNIGGRVPLVSPEEPEPDDDPGKPVEKRREAWRQAPPEEDPEIGADGCAEDPDRGGPWRSGNGVEGGLFKSWIFITE